MGSWADSAYDGEFIPDYPYPTPLEVGLGSNMNAVYWGTVTLFSAQPVHNLTS
jgi:hypothetical protein